MFYDMDMISERKYLDFTNTKSKITRVRWVGLSGYYLWGPVAWWYFLFGAF